MATSKHCKLNLQIVLLNIIIVFLVEIGKAQATIPARYDGFVYSLPDGPDFISIEAFLDPVCPDSRDSWLPLKQLVHHYASSILLIVHPFSLPLVPSFLSPFTFSFCLIYFFTVFLCLSMIICTWFLFGVWICIVDDQLLISQYPFTNILDNLRYWFRILLI